MLKKYSKEDQEKLFVVKPLYQRSIIVAAGPFANFLLAIFIFAFIYMFAGKDFTPAQIQEVQIESPAEEAGIKSGDIIQSINGKDVNSIMEVSAFINSSSSETVEIGILRNDSELTFSVKPDVIKGEDSLGNKANKKIIGIKIAKITGQVAKMGFIAFLSIMAYISISLGFINLLPIPMLDGGHLMLSLIHI